MHTEIETNIHTYAETHRHVLQDTYTHTYIHRSKMMWIRFLKSRPT
jgi:hypothetical protein